MSNQSGIPESYDDLKAVGYPAVHEFIDKDGWYVVKIDHMLSTANAFPGSEVACTEGWAIPRLIAFKEYHKWMDDYITWVESLQRKAPVAIGQDSLMAVGMDLV